MPPPSARRFLVLGTTSAGIAVAAGAFGAHALRARLEPRLLAVFETGARYQMYHALALVAVGVLLTLVGGGAAADAPARPLAPRPLLVAGWCFVAGTLLFSGSLYALALTGVGVLGAITPLGGVAFLAGWSCLAVGIAMGDWRPPA